MAKVKAKQDLVSYEVIVQSADDGTDDVLIPIPPELMERLGWKVGEEIDFNIDKSGRIIVKNVKK